MNIGQSKDYVSVEQPSLSHFVLCIIVDIKLRVSIKN